MVSSRGNAQNSRTRRPPATTPEARENQMIALAVGLTEKQLREGTASAQVITHYLKLATTKNRLEEKKLALEADLLKARTEQIASVEEAKQLADDAIKAMRMYQGVDSGEVDDY